MHVLEDDAQTTESTGTIRCCSGVRHLIPFVLLLAACSSPEAAAVVTDDGAEPIQLSMSLYVLDAADGDATLSSQRELTEVEGIAKRINDIWAQAGIELSVETVTRIDVPAAVLADLAAGDTSSFFQAAGDGGFTVPGAATINGFYVRQIGGANGMAPFGSRIFYVADEPTVHDERVSSHEIGHILGLHHDLEDNGRLMFSGTNGTDLTEDEITSARYAATGILDGVR